jgi:hypothetical protein
MKRLACALSALALLAACAGTPQREDGQTARDAYLAYAGDSVSRISYYGRINGWRPLSRDELVIWTTANDAYLVTVVPACIELQSATQIGVTSRTGRNWVSSGRDDVLVGRDSCRIMDIRTIDYRRMRAEERADE